MWIWLTSWVLIICDLLDQSHLVYCGGTRTAEGRDVVSVCRLGHKRQSGRDLHYAETQGQGDDDLSFERHLQLRYTEDGVKSVGKIEDDRVT